MKTGDTKAVKTLRIMMTVLALCVAGAGSGIAQSAGGSGYAADRPERGITKAAVERRFGTPSNRIGAVGDPPISRWVYSEFTVYFEYDRVIHSVSNRR